MRVILVDASQGYFYFPVSPYIGRAERPPNGRVARLAPLTQIPAREAALVDSIESTCADGFGESVKRGHYGAV